MNYSIMFKKTFIYFKSVFERKRGNKYFFSMYHQDKSLEMYSKRLISSSSKESFIIYN